MTPTYAEYVAYAKERGFQPLGIRAFVSLLASGFNPISGQFSSKEG